MTEYKIIFDEREDKIVHEAMERLELSAEAVVRRFCRMGQLVDHHIQQGYALGWVKDGEVVDPFSIGPKMAPMPEYVKSCGCTVGECICDNADFS